MVEGLWEAVTVDSVLDEVVIIESAVLGGPDLCFGSGTVDPAPFRSGVALLIVLRL